MYWTRGLLDRSKRNSCEDRTGRIYGMFRRMLRESERFFFRECPSLSRLAFGSGETLKLIVRDTYQTLEESLEHLDLTKISSLFRIEVEEDGADLSFPGWIPVADEGSHLALVRDLR
jgi:hypothetical protein